MREDLSPFDGVSPRDAHSYAEPEEARVRHVSLDLTADFEATLFAGRATLDLEVSPAASRVVLDTRDLTIARVADAQGRELPFTLGELNPILGRSLSIALPRGTARIAVEYQTSPNAAALQWLAPEQTAGGHHPFLYSQGHAILTRSWIPTQDSPALRQTYDARIRVPAGLEALMSAETRRSTSAGTGGREQLFEFQMTRAIPPSLIAIAVGELQFSSLGPRTGVWAEPVLLERARTEFADLERMVASAEAIVGPYMWKRLDVLVMPPSFPFGGMENPRLVFVSPTIVVGDRSLTSLLAHELAHAWSGTLVSNATWSDFWLNEGFTVYLELRIIEALYGPARRAMLEVYGRGELTSEIERLGPSSPDTKLKVNLEGRDALEGVTTIPYIKGAALLQVIERTVGRERFDAYLRSWFERHAFCAVTTEVFVSDVRAHLLAGDPSIEPKIGLDEWIYGPGLPQNAEHPRSDALANAERLAATFAGGLPVDDLDTDGWTTQEWRHFLNALPRDIGTLRLQELDETRGLSGELNGEILAAWLRLAIHNAYEPARPALERFLIGQGRRKFLKPLYEELMTSHWGQDLARLIYLRARPRYHATTRAALDPIVGIGTGPLGAVGS